MKIWKIILPVAATLLLTGQAVAQSNDEDRDDEQPARLSEIREAELEMRMAEAEMRMAEAARQIRGLEQTRVSELGRVGQHLLGGSADRDQPALGLVAGVRDDAGDMAVDERRDVGDGLLDHLGHSRDVCQEPEWLDVLEILG